MKITVVLCTYNRCLSLAKALESASALRLPSSTEWEVLIVDNNSSDGTREVAEEFCRSFPGHFRYLFEPQPGKSHALNSGIRNTTADVVAFMDDDVTVEPTWLQQLTDPLHGGSWAGSGGRIVPDQQFVPPRWLSLDERYALAPLAMFDYGPGSCELKEAPFGTNMAFRRETFAKHGGFRTDLGPRPGSEIRSEDTEFGRRLLAAGDKLWYEPSAVVHHSISQQRLHQDYFLKWWYDKARADTRAFGVEPGTRWFVGGIPLYLLRRLAIWKVRWMLALDPKRRFLCKVKAASVAGVIAEYRNSLHVVRDGIDSVNA